jgi:riboflavin synthase
MFTGIIDSLGIIRQLRRTDRALVLAVEPLSNPYEVAPGDSVSINGVCLTLESRSGEMLFFTAVYETLNRTTLAKASSGTKVNLERALRPIDRLGGHIVLGHVDGIGRVLEDKQVGAATIRTIQAPRSIRAFLAPKGSIAVDGVSLTVVDSTADSFSVSLVPYTLSATTLGKVRIGEDVNLESDILARYIYRLLQEESSKTVPPHSTPDDSLLSKLERMGF